ncbi:MAG: T9SS type A sorting domain-containing protein, partial [Prolixibacteraceae bacterium]|nr:T9SS type A sorting domain-containing protein [Prolixibacteraceae bacterium]
STGETTESITVNIAGEYSLTQTVDGCTSDAATAMVTPITLPVITNITENDPIFCQGSGALGFTFSGVPSGIYNIEYDGGSFQNVPIVLNAATVLTSAGTYNNLKITVGQCTSVGGINASLSDPNPPPTPTISVYDSCGFSILTASNYTGTLNWSTGETTESISVTISDEYWLTQTVDGCMSDAAVATASPSVIPAIETIVENDPTVCEGDGSLEITFSGVPNGIYTIAYDGGSFTGISVTEDIAIIQAPSGEYNNLTIELGECTSATGVNAILSTPTPPSKPVITVADNCGESQLTASGYSGSLIWNTGETTESIIVTSPGEYALIQTLNGCISDTAKIIASPKSIPVITNITENNPEVCQAQGSLEFTFTGVPDGNYTINYDGNSFSNIPVVDNKATVTATAGAYNNITITVNGCSSASGTNASLSDPNPPSTPTISVQNNCGESILTASNYTGTLNWSTGESTNSIVVDKTGIYSVTQIVNGCTSNAATVNATPKIIPEITNVTVTDPNNCEGSGILELSFNDISNGEYVINYDGGNFNNVSVVSNKASIQAAAGTYNNLVITINGCSSSEGINAVITAAESPDEPTITVVDNCGESIITASNYTGDLLWNTGESTPSITVNTPGEYSVTQTIGGCTSDAASIYASPKTTPQITNVSENDPAVCQGQGTLNFEFSDVPDGTYSIVYDGGSFTNVAVINNSASVLATARSYNNLKINVDGCISASIVSASLSDPNPPPAPSILVDDYCGESVLTAINYTGSLTWDTGDTTESITVLTAREYTLTQTIDGCTSNAATAFANPQKSSLQPEIEVENYCGESEIIIHNLSENAWLFWELDNAIDSIQGESLTVTASGEYSVYQKLGNCESQDTFLYVNPIALPALPIATNKEICATEPLQPLMAEAFSPEDNTAIKWFDSSTGGNEVLSPELNTVGTITYYAETINSLTGCVSESRLPVTLTIKPNAKYTLLDASIIDKPKGNVAVLIFPKDSLKYQWYLNNEEINNATGQYYYINETDRKTGNIFTIDVELQNGCNATFDYAYISTDNEPDAFKNADLSDFDRLFAIYPNPVSNNLNIATNKNLSADELDLNVKIYAVDGTLVLSTQLNQNPEKINIQHLKPGYYTINIFDKQSRLTSEKLIITHH